MALLDPTLWFWLPLAMGLILMAPMMLAQRRASVFVCSGVSLILVLVSFMAMAGWAWLLRDGLGPDCISSSGLSAWKRFWEGLWLPTVLATTAVVVIVTLARWRLATWRGVAGDEDPHAFW